MPGQNNDGLAGFSTEQIAVEKNIIVGMQAPNNFPCVKIDENGKSLPKMIVAENGGTQVIPSTGYNCSCADTSWLSYCGKYNISAGNKINLSSGGGGVEVVTTGPFRIHNRYTDFVSTHAFSLNTRLFTVAATKRMQFAGGRCDFNFDTNYFSGNVNFLKNVHVNGGMFVNGELICRHITTQSQMNLTELSDDVEGFINPKQNFTFLGTNPTITTGASTQTGIAITGLTLSGAATGTLTCSPIKEGATEISVTGAQLTITSASATNITSKNTTIDGNTQFELNIPSVKILSNSFYEGIAGGKVTPDVKMPGHMHAYKTPACNFLDNSAAVCAEAKKLTESDTPFEAKPTYPNGKESMDIFVEQVKEVITKQAEEWVTEWFEGQFPFQKP